MLVDLDGLTDNGRITCETFLPIFVAENEEGVFAWYPAFIGSEEASGGRLEAEHCEVVAANEFGPGAFGATLGAKIDGVGCVCCDVRKNGGEFAIVLEIG